jgi:NodT family efflux transporter outer membrane factor (OMF) lipoprotein
MGDPRSKFGGKTAGRLWRALPGQPFYSRPVGVTPFRKFGTAQKADFPILPAQHRSTSRALIVTALFSAATLSACLDWDKPEVTVETPPAFRAAKPKSAPPIAAARDFATKFGSPELTALVEHALDENFDISAAVARIDQADAQARIASASLYPNISMNDIARTQRTPGTIVSTTSGGGATSAGTNSTSGVTGSSTTTSSTGGGFRGRTTGFFQLALTASYEIDFWGKNYDASQSARLLANASRFDRDVVEIATVASVLNAYFQVLAAQDRLRIANENIKIADTVLQAIKARLEVGTATALDFAQQESVLATQRASVPPLEQTLRQTKNNLAVLIGETPESVQIKGGSLERLRFPQVKPGLPSELLLRRPDVAEAEEKLASQEFTVRQARAAFFPSIQLTGQYGVQSALLKNLLRPEAIAYQLALNLVQPLFDGYNLQGQIMLSKGRYAELAALYQKQILTALSEAENALIAVSETAQQLKLQAQAVGAARRAYEAANMRLREGTIDIVTMSTTETTLFQNQDILAQVRLAYFQSATSLYQSLGGGWTDIARAVEIANAAAAYEADKGPWP